MIIARLIGGLGNQMFQYAIARKLAIFHNVPVKLDITEYQQSPFRTFGLCNFSIHAELADETEIARFRRIDGAGSLSRFKRVPDFYKPYYKRRVFREQYFQYDPNIQKCGSDVYLEGFWQSEKYFKDIEPVIRKDFTPAKNSDALNEKMAEQIRNCEAVCLHVRRGDYISNPAIHAIHGICSEDYYYEAIGIVEQEIKNPQFFIFSDDPAWVKEHFTAGHPTIVMDTNAAEKDYEDLRLMSLCKHHIIANSSFSWWGAWLSIHPQKIVIAPKKWFNKPDFNTKDLIPEHWIRV